MAALTENCDGMAPHSLGICDRVTAVLIGGKLAL